MSDVSITKLTLDGLRDSLQQVGYRVEAATDPVAGVAYLRSATGGLAFDIRPGNQLPDADGGFVDVAFTAVLQVQGELPLDLVNRWNATRRFARLQLSQAFLVFCLDISVAGGVMPDYLRAQIEIWDGLVQELIAYLRDELRQLSAKTDPAPPAAAQAPEHQKVAEARASATVQ